MCDKAMNQRGHAARLSITALLEGGRAVRIWHRVNLKTAAAAFDVECPLRVYLWCCSYATVIKEVLTPARGT